MPPRNRGGTLQLADRTDYGLRLLLSLGTASGRRSVDDLAAEHGLSRAHVAKVVQRLQNAGFVDTFRGRGGGVSLARLPEDIGIGEVVRALEPHMHLVECFRPGRGTCRFTGRCKLTHTLVRAKAAMLRELDATTLADVLDPALAD